MTDTRARTTAALVGLSIALSLVLSGCSFAPSGGATGGGSSGGADSGQSDGGNTTTDPGPDINLDDSAGLPDTFPTDVPIIDGEVAFGLDLGTGWSIVIPVDDLAGGYADASARLTSGGFEARVDTTTDAGSVGVFSSDKYQINVNASDTADFGNAVTYVVVILG